jgi:exoribonuclease R
MCDIPQIYIDKCEIPCILVLSGNKTYGRSKNNTKKMLYKCVPNDNDLPCLLVPFFQISSLEKVRPNLFVSIVFDLWEKTEKHPLGRICNSYGNVDDPEKFYEYQLVCNNLCMPIKSLQKYVCDIFKQQSIDTIIDELVITHKINDRTNWDVISIDPAGSRDLDDAFGIKMCSENTNIKQISVYIANVTMWVDALKLWPHLSRRISSVYLPNKIVPMLPPQLSTDACSLLQGKRRIALTLDIFIKENVIYETAYSNCLIKVNHNYDYDDPKLLSNPIYSGLYDAMSNYLSCRELDSHELVAQLMILMNHKVALKLSTYHTGVYRITELNQVTEKIISPEDVTTIQNIPTMYASYITPNNDTYSGVYTTNTDTSQLEHKSLNLCAYVHITSPIRRLVDVLNSIVLQKSLSLLFSPDADEFYSCWTKDNNITYINKSMRNISKVQSSCKLLDLCLNLPLDSRNIQGYIFGCRKTDINNVYKYDVYLPKLKMYSTVHSPSFLANYGLHTFKIITFDLENTLKKKIRLQIVD